MQTQSKGLIHTAFVWCALTACLVTCSALTGCDSDAASGGSGDRDSGASTSGGLDTSGATSSSDTDPTEGDGQTTSTDTSGTSGALDVRLDVDALDVKGPLTAALPCAGEDAEVYGFSLSSLGAPDPAKRGEVVACAQGRAVTALEAQTRLGASSVLGVVAGGDIQTLRVAYRTERSGGAVGVSSALVYLPQSPPDGPLPLVVIAHGTVGIADACAPSTALLESLLDYVALPWAAAGYPVIATDYAGLGTEGAQGYGDNVDTGQSVLDAAKALRAMLPPERLTEQVFLVGHSQGGGAVLSAQALERTYGSGGKIAGALAFAPGWQISVNAEPWKYPFASTALGGGAPAALTAMFLYAFHANAYGEDRAGDGFPDLTAAGLVAAVESQCVTQLSISVPLLTGTFLGLVDETFRQTFVDCAEGGACAPPGDAFAQMMRDNILQGDPQGGPVVIFQGIPDVVAPATDTACVIDHLARSGVTAQVCADLSPHTNVVQNNTALALQWVEAQRQGQPLPTCSAVGMPTCLTP